ncbi:16S rRNA (cytidine1402-2'-O)-methyltransferase [Arachidicoccus rhizosphaerae]|jgi:16S rRNA (cytidine1402-2'-O)-methyltransferase|uniref:Ribosomal RNA small subunit methyltransferase I n=1 Tax=Arachidicoccus rhizosphaerae TaxID=551991 RepID=A0A1H3ZJS8_9BACT|nr:16S rRNA (cytidine(1402)-2'-O)-methyltransferase [Arachidicoccus rhizosphaerae]SEA23915.1 16S rRNA (cytidine1402-2'-O)-methyltransferase [Arachidicoccus rhizosphaerae]
MLYIVPTPVGNLKDMTLRSIEVLQASDLILCEDTRTSGRLLQHYGIQKQTVSYHMHNEHKIVERLVDQLAAGTKMALITDAGTPGISDPAFLLVRACAQRGVRVETLPGATAFVPALVSSGIPCNRFCFEGFLPLKKGRQTLMKQLAEETRTMVFYESPMRLVKTLQEMIGYFGAERPCSVSREISKLYEETFRGSLLEVHAHYQEAGVKGEIVLIVQGKS